MPLSFHILAVVEPTGLWPRTKVLLTCGTNDTQVPCVTTNALTTALRRAHAGGPGRVALPGVDHLLHDADHPKPKGHLFRCRPER